MEVYYDREDNECTNTLRPRRFKWCDFSTNFIGYQKARHFLPVRFFPKYCFNKLCFQLPQTTNNARD